MDTHTHGIAETLSAKRRTRALARELRITARVLNGAVRDLIVESHGPAPAWTDFERLYLNESELPGVTEPGDVAIWAGAMLHELGHTLFTPRPGSTLHKLLEDARRTIAPNVFHVLNVVEDSRQERAMVAKLPRTRGYLTALVVALIVESGSAEDSWPLITGRTWLPLEARSKSRAAWTLRHGAESAARVAALVGEYQTLTEPGERDAVRAAAIVVELARILAPAAAPAPKCQSQRGGESVETPASDAPTAATEDGDVEDAGAEDAPAEDVDTGAGAESVEDAEDAEDGSTEDVDGSGSGSDVEDAEDGSTEDVDGSGSTEDAGAEDGSAESERESAEDVDGSGSGSGSDVEDAEDAEDGAEDSTESAPADTGVEDALRDAVAETLAAEDVAADLSDYLESLEDVTRESESGSGDKLRHAEPSVAAANVREDLTETLSELRAAVEPAWRRGVSAGRVNAGRLVAPVVAPSKLFDRYSAGARDAVATECVLLVDTSSSMSHVERELSESVWTLRHAAAAAGVTLHVFSFGSATRLLWSAEDVEPGDRVPLLSANGGTHATPALVQAWDILSGSRLPHRVLVTLTDGAWSGDVDAADSLVAAMREDGVATVALHYGSDGGASSHGAETFAVVDSLSALPAIFAELVADILESVALR
jgi:VWA domain containing CoxE-like protein